MLLSSLRFSEEVGQLQLGWHILKNNGMLITMKPSKESIDTNNETIHITSFTGSLAIYIAPVLSHRRGVAASQEIPKSANNHQSHMISKVVVASARSSASVLERDTTACFLDFHAIGEDPRVPCDGTTICWVTRPSGVRVSMKLKRTNTSIK
jgi:hypothetical protein